MPELDRRRVLVMVVDDDADLLDSVRMILESFDYDVICAGDSLAAIAAVAARAPDIVLTDIYMPGADGFELLNALRSRAEAIPVVAMSGGGKLGDYDNLAVARHLGAVAILDKPFRPAQLVETIDRALSDHRGPSDRTTR